MSEKLYEVMSNYRSPNKVKKGEFMLFKRGVYVYAEPYSSGLNNAAPMVIHNSEYIIPLSHLRELSEAEESNVIGQANLNKVATTLNPEGKVIEKKSEETITGNDSIEIETESGAEEKSNPENTEIATTDKLSLIKNVANNYAIGAVLGGIAGFMIGRYLKAGKLATFTTTVIGVAGGAYAFNKYKTKKAAK